jgi:hypothetical protein
MVIMKTAEFQKTKHTPRHAPGFMERLDTVFSTVGIRPREYVSVIMQATGLSKSGARLVIESQRPPKQLQGFVKLNSYLMKMLHDKHIEIDEAALSDYLLLDSANPLSKNTTEFSLAPFIEQDAILTSQIILLIENLAKEHYGDKSFDDKKKELIYFRMLSYAFKNNAPSDSDIVKKHSLDLLSLANDNLI